jgi:hypothetical protein
VVVAEEDSILVAVITELVAVVVLVDLEQIYRVIH